MPQKHTYRNQSVDEALLPLSVSPAASHGLLVIGRVPVRVKHHQTIGSDQVQATPTSLTAQHEDEFRGLHLNKKRTLSSF